MQLYLLRVLRERCECVTLANDATKRHPKPPERKWRLVLTISGKMCSTFSRKILSRSVGMMEAIRLKPQQPVHPRSHALATATLSVHVAIAIMRRTHSPNNPPKNPPSIPFDDDFPLHMISHNVHFPSVFFYIIIWQKVVDIVSTTQQQSLIK